jgi:hypothetical protein
VLQIRYRGSTNDPTFGTLTALLPRDPKVTSAVVPIVTEDEKISTIATFIYSSQETQRSYIYEVLSKSFRKVLITPQWL